MLGQIDIKRAIKLASNWAAITTHSVSKPVAARKTRRACIFYYHRVADVDFIDRQIDDHNVLPSVFERQIAALSEFAEIVPLTEITERAAAARQQRDGDETDAAKPLVSLTFDDGFANFYTQALPVLQKFDAPATLSIVTSVMNSDAPMSFDKWALKNSRKASPEAWRAISSEEIEKCLASGLVTLGAHSHRHLRANDCTGDEISEEVYRSAEILRARFGKSSVPVFAYPYGNTFLGHVPEHYEQTVRRAGFALAVTTDFGQVSETKNQFLLPRIEAHALDSPMSLRAKIEGAFSPFRLHDYCRAAKYRLINGKNQNRKNYVE